MKKYELGATEEQVETFKKAIHLGTPLEVALSYAGISPSTYYYWVEIASVVAYVKDGENIRRQDESIQSGIGVSQVREDIRNGMLVEPQMRSSIGYHREPKGDAIQRYRTNGYYRVFADQVHAMVKEFDRLRSEIVVFHMAAIRDAAKERGSVAQSSMWFLERTLPEHFGKDRQAGQEQLANQRAQAVRIEFVDSQAKESKDRIAAMEELIAQERSGKGEA